MRLSLSGVLAMGSPLMSAGIVVFLQRPEMTATVMTFSWIPLWISMLLHLGSSGPETAA